MMETMVRDGNNNMPEVTKSIKDMALQQLVKSTGYSLAQINGQRKYGGPPPGWDPSTEPPERGCEVFVGKIPRDIFEDELVPVFQRVGKIYEFRLMMDFSGTNRGYAFCTYCEKADAKRAIKELNNFEIKKGRFLGVCSSVDNCRLFIGGIPKTKVRDEILSEISKVTEGVVDVIVYPSAMDKSKNRGFAFVEYENHRAAAMARRKLIPGRIQLWGHTIAVDWAEPEPEADEDIMANVRILYIRNLMLNTTEETIKRTFEEAVVKKDCVERVKKLKDYAFVHFTSREDAILAMEVVNGSYVDGALVEVVLAKPVDKNEHNAKLNKTKALSQGSPVFDIDASLSSLYGRSLAQLSLPSRNRGTRSAGGTKSYTSTINIRKHPIELLEELCKKSNWGIPTYQLHSAIQRDPVTNADCHLFLYKVALPVFPTLSFQPNKLCRTVEEAKIYAAEYTLLQLGVPIESSDVTMPTPIGTPTAVAAAAYLNGGGGGGGVVVPNHNHNNNQNHHNNNSTTTSNGMGVQPPPPSLPPQPRHSVHHHQHPHTNANLTNPHHHHHAALTHTHPHPQHVPPTIAMPHPQDHRIHHVPSITSSAPAVTSQFVVGKVLTAPDFATGGYEYSPHAVYTQYQA